MPTLSTGPIENNAVAGVRPSQQVTVRLVNPSSTNNLSAILEGYYLTGIRNLYVSESYNLTPGQVVTRTYFADLDAYEFVLNAPSVENEFIEASVWGKRSSGELSDTQRIVLREINQ